jgi:hypothetical protein
MRSKNSIFALCIFQTRKHPDRRLDSKAEASVRGGNHRGDLKRLTPNFITEAGGIFDGAHMECFYNTFYKNPTADWRYILGLEPALMPDAELKIFQYGGASLRNP